MKEESFEKPQNDMKPEKATDMEFADFLIEHINKPCEVEVAPGQMENLRDFYIREAEKAIGKMKDLAAVSKLKAKIECYKK